MNYLKNNKNSTNFYCFSPPVMIATFAIEIFLAAYILYRYKMNGTIKLIAVLLGFLALFQLSEFNVCGGSAASAWSRIGFVAITALPPLGMHLMNKITGQKNNYLNKIAYTSMGFLMVYFLVAPTAFSGNQCTGNYVIFQLDSMMSKVYTLYYYGWLLAAIATGVRRLTSNNFSLKQKRQIKRLLVGYAVFILPTASIIIFNPTTVSGIPSIMCGFAVFLALILAFKIAPNSSEVVRQIKVPFINKEV